MFNEFPLFDDVNNELNNILENISGVYWDNDTQFMSWKNIISYRCDWLNMSPNRVTLTIECDRRKKYQFIVSKEFSKSFDTAYNKKETISITEPQPIDKWNNFIDLMSKKSEELPSDLLLAFQNCYHYTDNLYFIHKGKLI